VFRKVRGNSNFAQFGNEGKVCISTYVQRRPFEIQTPKYWNMIDRSTAVSPLALSPRSILLPPPSHFRFFPERSFSARFSKTLFFSFPYFLKILFRNGVTYSCVNPGNVCSHYLYRRTVHSVVNLINTPTNAHVYI